MQVEDDDDSEFNFEECAIPDKGSSRAIGDEPRLMKTNLNTEAMNEEFGDKINLLDIDT